MTEKNKTYTATDFERYYSGTMPSGEMHNLEKAALEDPFLADALEGYVYATSFKNDIAELKEKLNETRKKKKIFSVSSLAQNGWWRIAALFIIIAGAGYFFYKLNYINKENSFAQNDIKSGLQKKDSATTNNDSAITNDIAFENQTALKADENKKNGLPQTAPEVKQNVLRSDLKKESEISSDSAKFRSNDDYIYNDNDKSVRKEYDKTGSVKYLLKGRVTDEKGKAIAHASVKDKSMTETTLTDSSGYFMLPSADSNTTATVIVTGYATKKVDLQKDKEPVVAMNKSNSNLDAFAAASSNQNKNLEDTTRSLKGLQSKAAGIEVYKSKTYPLTTNEKFDAYLKENIKPVYDENNKHLTGEVLLSFTINKKSRPRNIKVVKSSCSACVTEAIRLLENGPDWIGKRNSVLATLIKFQ